MGMIKRAMEELNRNGLFFVLKKVCHKTRLLCVCSTCSTWFVRNLDQPLSEFTPDLDLETIFLVEDKSEIVDWLIAHHTVYPWIYYRKEVEIAQSEHHPYLMLKHMGEIIGYIKIGLGRVYIHDYHRIVSFDPNQAFIYDTFIVPSYRGHNLALFAANETARYLKMEGIKQILCHIEEWNIPSILTFRKAGFQTLEPVRHIRIGFLSFFLRSGRKPFLHLEKVLHLWSEFHPTVERIEE